MLFWIFTILVYIAQTYLLYKYRYHIIAFILQIFISKAEKLDRIRTEEDYKPLVEGEDYVLPN